MGSRSNAPLPRYDRAYLLGDGKRNHALALWEVLRYGSDSFGDPDYVSLYGLKPADWYARGIRLLARTAVECTRDALADLIGRDVAATAHAAPAVTASVVVDPFAGSGNTLYWLARHTHTQRAVGFERDERVFQTSRRNLAILGFDVELSHVGYEAGLANASVADDELLIVFVAPPWGDALDEVTGLDLRLTQPPIRVIIELIARAFPRTNVLLAVQVHERTLHASISEVSSQCSWSALKIYDVNADGQNHGILLGTLGWSL